MLIKTEPGKRERGGVHIKNVDKKKPFYSPLSFHPLKDSVSPSQPVIGRDNCARGRLTSMTTVAWVTKNCRTSLVKLTCYLY